MLSVLSQRFTSRVLVRAFTTSVTLPAARTLATANVNVGGVSRARFLSTTGAASVEEDLDAALDTILGDAFMMTDDPVDMEKAEVNDSPPVPKQSIEEVSERNSVNCSVVCLKQTYGVQYNTL